MYEQLHDLAIYASKGRAGEYQKVWSEWRYSDLVEFAVGIRKSQEALWDEIGSKEYEYAESYTSALLERILERL